MDLDEVSVKLFRPAFPSTVTEEVFTNAKVKYLFTTNLNFKKS